MNLYKYISNFSLVAISVSGFFLLSCSNEEMISDPEGSGLLLKVGAQVMPVTMTRAYQESGPINEGTFYITYKNVDSEDDLAKVDFQNGTGTIWKDSSKQLEWTDIGYNESESLSVFYLDNVAAEGQTEDCKVDLTTSNPFVAGKFDEIEGSNDLLWGEREISINSPIVNFQMHHCMSRINVEVTLDNSIEDGPFQEIDLEHATVKITSLIHVAEKYDRLTGDLILSGSPDYKDLILVKPAQEDWKTISPANAEPGEQKIFTSCDFVLPPQELLTTDQRPRLSITVPVDGEGKTFSGMIPRVMEMQLEDGTKAPMTLSLLRGHALTIHARISPNPLEIIFMPVTVQDWVNKGTFLLGVNQAGLDNDNDIQNFIQALTSGEEEEILKFGYKDQDGKWIFNIFCDLTLNLNDVAGVLGQYGIGDFTFDMNGWEVTIEDENGDVVYLIKKAEDLVKLLINGTI